MNNRRQSGGGAVSVGDVSLHIDACFMTIRDLAEQLRGKLVDTFPAEKVTGWNKRILDLATETARLEREAALFADRLSRNPIVADQSSSSTRILTADSIAKQVKDDVADQMSRFNSADCDMYNKIQSITKVLFYSSINLYARLNHFTKNHQGNANKKRKSDDIEVIDTGYKESDFICPYTKTKMDVPMKRYLNPFFYDQASDFEVICSTRCPHRISRAGLESMLGPTKRSVACVQIGCTAVWTRDTSEPDKEFAHAMEKFYRRKNARVQTSQDDDEEEKNYTSIL
jgi:hypothetical protein